MWDIAMGKSSKKRSLRTIPMSDTSPSHVPLKIPFEKAHGGRVVHISYRDPKQIISVAQDRETKIFCAGTGSLLKTTKLKDKPLAAVYFNTTLFVGERNGLRVLIDYPTGYEEAQGMSNPHVGSVTALAACAEWGLCSGGNDAHVFVHGL
jgi:hypothetical protein